MIYLFLLRSVWSTNFFHVVFVKIEEHFFKEIKEVHFYFLIFLMFYSFKKSSSRMLLFLYQVRIIVIFSLLMWEDCMETTK